MIDDMTADIHAALRDTQSEYCLLQDNRYRCAAGEQVKILELLRRNEAELVIGVDSWSGAVICHAFPTALGRSIPLRSEGAGLRGELPVKFAQRHARIVKVAIECSDKKPRQRRAVADSWRGLWEGWRARLFHDAYVDPDAAMLGEMASARNFNQWMADTISPWISGDVLELGAGIGNLTVLLHGKSEQRYVATDTDQEHLRQLRARLAKDNHLEVAAWDAAQGAEGRLFERCFGTVVALNVLEHIADDAATLRNIYGCLRPGGTAVVLVPQGAAAFGSLDEVLHHKRRYSEAELKQKMKDAGFATERMLRFNRITYPGWLLNARIFRRRTLSRVQLRLFDLTVPLWRRVDTYLPWPSTSLIAIGRRES